MVFVFMALVSFCCTFFVFKAPESLISPWELAGAFFIYFSNWINQRSWRRCQCTRVGAVKICSHWPAKLTDGSWVEVSVLYVEGNLQTLKAWFWSNFQHFRCRKYLSILVVKSGDLIPYFLIKVTSRNYFVQAEDSAGGFSVKID